MRDVLKVFGVGGELAEEFPLTFDRAELLFSNVLFLVWAEQLVLAQDSSDGVVAARQEELKLEALSSEAGLATQPDDLSFQAAGDLVGAVVGAAALFGQGGGLARLIAPEPFAHGVAGAAEFTSSGFETFSPSEGDQLLMQPMAIGAHAIQLKVGAVHRHRIASFARRCFVSSGG